MGNLPKSTKILISFVIILILSVGVVGVRNTSFVKNKLALKYLEEMKVENPEKVMKKYNQFSNKEEADAYLVEQVDKVGNTLTKEEKDVFGENILLNYINVYDTTIEEMLFINYHKIEDSEKELEIINQYISNENSYPVTIIYETNKDSITFGRFIFVDLQKQAGSLEGEVNYDVQLPRAFLVSNNNIIKEYEKLEDMQLKGVE